MVSLCVKPRFTVKVYKAEEGGYWAECPELPGCFTQGESIPEVRRNAREAISLYIETLAERMAPHVAVRRGRPVAELSFALAPA
jgi:predicted RNase H-like HicB family nuclease